MTDRIIVRGIVATALRGSTDSKGRARATFRLASNQRHLDRTTGAWVDGHTNWYTIEAFRALATNALASLRKGDRVIVTGSLAVHEHGAEDYHGITAVIDAETIGHDLGHGTSIFTRVIPARPAEERTGIDQTDAPNPVPISTATAPGAPAGPQTVDPARSASAPSLVRQLAEAGRLSIHTIGH
jgi:single-strand DNA-binding protein